jgi:hypothetical protein
MRSIAFIYISILIAYVSTGQNNPNYYFEGENLTKKTEQFLFIKVSVDKNSAFEGECIKADYHLFVAVDLQGKMSKAPSYSGFASYDISRGQDNEYQVEKRNGVLFKIYHIKSVQLFGLSPGIQRIEPIALDATVRYRKKTKELEQPEEMSTRDTLLQFELRSQPVEITIKPLPEKEDGFFSGAVGQFELRTALTSGNISLDEPDTFQIALSGNGNWHEVGLPEIIFPHGIERFEPVIQEAYNEKIVPVEGVKVISYPFVVNEKRRIIFQPVTFTFFNPENKIYQTIIADTLFLEVRDEKYQPVQNKPFPKTEDSDFTNLLLQFAIILFPLTALLLSVLLWVYYRKSKKK